MFVHADVVVRPYGSHSLRNVSYSGMLDSHNFHNFTMGEQSSIEQEQPTARKRFMAWRNLIINHICRIMVHGGQWSRPRECATEMTAARNMYLLHGNLGLCSAYAATKRLLSTRKSN